MLRLMVMVMARGPVIAVIVLLTACTGEGTSPRSALSTTSVTQAPSKLPMQEACGLYEGTASPRFRPDLLVIDAEPFVGKTPKEAEALAAQQAGTVRVVGQDGRCTEALSDDLANNRVNIYLEDGRVTNARTF